MRYLEQALTEAAEASARQVAELARQVQEIQRLRAEVHRKSSEMEELKVESQRAATLHSLGPFDGVERLGQLGTVFGLSSREDIMRFAGDELLQSLRVHSDATPVLDRLTWFFLHYRLGRSFKEISKYTGLCDSYICTRVEAVVPALNGIVIKYIGKRSPEQLLGAMKDAQKEEFPNWIMLAVDGTDGPVTLRGRNSEKRRFYSPKYGRHVLRWTAVVDSAGRFLLCTRPVRGNKNDARAWEDCKIPRFLAGAYPDVNPVVDGRRYEMTVMGDKAYPTAEAAPGWSWHITMTGAKATTKARIVNGDRLNCTPTVATYRTVVERSFGQVKRWAYLSQIAMPWSRKRRFHSIVQIACALQTSNLTSGSESPRTRPRSPSE